MVGLIGSMLVVDIARITLTDFLASLVMAAWPYDLMGPCPTCPMYPWHIIAHST